jgi:hypothetical protein
MKLNLKEILRITICNLASRKTREEPGEFSFVTYLLTSLLAPSHKNILLPSLSWVSTPLEIHLHDKQDSVVTVYNRCGHPHPYGAQVGRPIRESGNVHRIQMRPVACDRAVDFQKAKPAPRATTSHMQASVNSLGMGGDSL